MMSASCDVVIVGAGSTGLLLAQGLRKAGISFRIFEQRAEDYPTREWGMSLHWGAEFLSKALPSELNDRLGEIDCDPHYDNSEDRGFLQCNGETGEVILDMKGVSPRRVSRQRLNKFLSQGIDIEFDKRLDRIEVAALKDVITAYFDDSSSVTARILIGCDGSRSKVRDILIGDKKLSDNRKAPYTLFNFTATFPDDVARSLRDIHPIFKVCYHPRLNMPYLLTIADGSSERLSEWKYQILMSWTGPPTASDLQIPEARLERLKELGKEFAHPWSTAAANVSADTPIYVGTYSDWDPRSVFKSSGNNTSWNGHEWHGLVTISGDAAHTMFPSRGQGLNNALEDASRLLAALSSVFKEKAKDLNTAISEYEIEMVARGGLEVEVTSKQSMAAHNWKILMEAPMFKHGTYKAK